MTSVRDQLIQLLNDHDPEGGVVRTDLDSTDVTDFWGPQADALIAWMREQGFPVANAEPVLPGIYIEPGGSPEDRMWIRNSKGEWKYSSPQEEGKWRDAACDDSDVLDGMLVLYGEPML